MAKTNTEIAERLRHTAKRLRALAKEMRRGPNRETVLARVQELERAITQLAKPEKKHK